jgi:hypothetical protein
VKGNKVLRDLRKTRLRKKKTRPLRLGRGGAELTAR